MARVNQPPHDVSAMDGYAVRAEDVADVARDPGGGRPRSPRAQPSTGRLQKPARPPGSSPARPCPNGADSPS